MKTYLVNEVFFSLQGEGVRAGTPSIFLRFAGCNQGCAAEIQGFDCDTAAETGQEMTLEDIVRGCREVASDCPWIVLTGGEPALQVDRELIDGLHEAGYKLAIETNGTIELPGGIDWITVSPKVPEERIRQRTADEIKYVRAAGQALPDTVVQAEYRLLSPAFRGHEMDPDALAWCIDLVKDHPDWRLSVQMHKIWGIQ